MILQVASTNKHKPVIMFTHPATDRIFHLISYAYPSLWDSEPGLAKQVAFVNYMCARHDLLTEFLKAFDFSRS